uniref:Uncharacterized protein n=1 Tax=Rhizophora mucronata TaxID=61149 RepID=A0A2P2N0E7_RHIMU
MYPHSNTQLFSNKTSNMIQILRSESIAKSEKEIRRIRSNYQLYKFCTLIGNKRHIFDKLEQHQFILPRFRIHLLIQIKIADPQILELWN